MANKNLTPGQIVRVISDDKFMEGQAAIYIREAMPGIAEIVIRGVAYWIQAERVGVMYGE